VRTQYIYDVDTPKKPVNLTANADLLQNAKDAGINLSQTFEDALLVKLRVTLEKQWLAENQEAIVAFNLRMKRDGVFATNKRRF
jgi:antitoxin CcdA